MAATFSEQPTPSPTAAADAAMAAAVAAQATADSLIPEIATVQAAVAAIDQGTEIAALIDAVADTNLLTDAERTAIASNTAAIAALPVFGSMATQNANGVAITGGSVAGITDLAVADGGTGASTAAAARAALKADEQVVTGTYTFTATAAGYTTEALMPILRAPWAMEIVSAYLTSGKASTGSTGSIYWQSHIRNVTQSLDLCSVKWNTNGSELAANAGKNLNVDQNKVIAAGDQISFGILSLGGPTSMQNSPWTVTLVFKRTE